jgi:hypothetical protein
LDFLPIIESENNKLDHSENKLDNELIYFDDEEGLEESKEEDVNEENEENIELENDYQEFVQNNLEEENNEEEEYIPIEEENINKIKDEILPFLSNLSNTTLSKELKNFCNFSINKFENLVNQDRRVIVMVRIKVNS